MPENTAKPRKKPWTVLVYMVADDPREVSPLTSRLIENWIKSSTQRSAPIQRI